MSLALKSKGRKGRKKDKWVSMTGNAMDCALAGGSSILIARGSLTMILSNGWAPPLERETMKISSLEGTYTRCYTKQESGDRNDISLPLYPTLCTSHIPAKDTVANPDTLVRYRCSILLRKPDGISLCIVKSAKKKFLWLSFERTARDLTFLFFTVSFDFSLAETFKCR